MAESRRLAMLEYIVVYRLPRVPWAQTDTIAARDAEAAKTQLKNARPDAYSIYVVVAAAPVKEKQDGTE